MYDRKKGVEEAEQKMLDDIEASTSRTYQHALRLKDEVNNQTRTLDDVEGTFISTKDALQKETSNINKARTMGRELCWMYGVIAVELVVLCLLLYVGLS